MALSFSASLHAKDLTLGLADLRRQLPTDTEIWVGGASPVLHRRALPGVRVLAGFAAIRGQVQQWRQAQALRWRLWLLSKAGRTVYKF